MRRSSRVLVTAVAVVTAAALLSGCFGTDKKDGFSEQTEQNGQRTGFEVGNAQIPADFPSAQVPLPDAGDLLASVREGQKRIRFFNLTFGMGGRNANAVGEEYADRLRKAGYRVREFSQTESSDYRLTTFNAIGDDWDVAVVSGRTSRNEPQQLSVQVSTHDTIITDLDELTQLDEGTSNPDPLGESTTSTSTP